MEADEGGGYGDAGEELENAAAKEVEDEYEEEEEEEEFEEDEGPEEDDEGYTLEFEEGAQALDLVQQAAGGADLYRQFQRLEYDALAERKRKALEEQRDSGNPAKKARQYEIVGATMEEIEEMMNFGLRRRRRRRSRDTKKRGRKKGSRNKLSPEVSRKIGDATLHYASGEYKEAIPFLHEAVRLAPNLPDAYFLLGLIYEALGDRRKAFNFHMIAAYFTPKDASLWKKLVAWSIEEKDAAMVKHCLTKAISADPKDPSLKFDGALLCSELGEYQKAAELYEQILLAYPSNTVARKMAAKMYRKCDQIDKAITVLEDYVNVYKPQDDTSVLNLLVSLYITKKAYSEALRQIENARLAFGSEEKLPFHLRAKAVICHAYLGDMEHAEVFLQDLQPEPFADAGELIPEISEIADTFVAQRQYIYAVKFFSILEKIAGDDSGNLYLKIAQCYASLKERKRAICYFYKAIGEMEHDLDARLILSSLLLDEGNEDECIILLSPPQNADLLTDNCSAQHKPWWLNGKIKMQLAKIYHGKGMLESFANTIFSSVHETLIIEAMNRKVRPMKKIPKAILIERAKLLGEQNSDNVFHGFRPIAPSTELVKAVRAKKTLEKRAALKEERKAAAITFGLDWQSDDSEDEAPRKERQEPPIPDLIKDAENHQLIVDLCKALASLQRYWEALEIINRTLKVAHDAISSEKKEELRSLGAQIAYGTRDPKHGFDYVRYIVQQHPYSTAAWNCYYKVVSRLEDRFSRHAKFLRHLRETRRDCVPPIVISGHHFTAISQHQAAARDYLEAYKLQPDNPLINLCAGTALINLALGFRLQNKHQCVVQGFAFLYKYLRLCGDSQEALYNVARAYHHVGLFTLAALYYEKVLAITEPDRPFPKLPYEGSSTQKDIRPGYCDLRREAAYNLHLIYKKSGATDLARQILKNHCTV